MTCLDWLLAVAGGFLAGVLVMWLLQRISYYRDLLDQYDDDDES